MAALILALLEEHQNALQVKDCLEGVGHDVVIADTFSQAIALLETKKIDLVISDVHLENGGNVFDFLRRVKKGQSTCKIPFVLFSSQPTPLAKYLADGIRTTARLLGAVVYIEMETFEAAQFSEHINSFITQQPLNAVKDSELEK